jgi:hypothetical protein
MLTLSILIDDWYEDRDGHESPKEYHKHEVTDVGQILWFCHYILRQVDDADMANAAKRLSELYVDDLLEHMRRAWPVEDSASNLSRT